jgi:hypothetical protein
MMRCLLSLLVITASAAAPAAAPRQVMLLGQAIAVPIPAGYCELGQHLAEAAVVDRLRAGLGNTNTVLAVFADCAEAAELRRGARAGVDNYGQIMAPRPAGELRRFSGVPRAEYIRQLSARADGILPGAMERGVERAQSFVPDTKFQESLGVLATDTNGLYFGVLMSAPYPDGEQKAVLGVVGMTLVKELPISINLYRAYKGAPELPELLARQRNALAGLVRANE